IAAVVRQGSAAAIHQRNVLLSGAAIYVWPSVGDEQVQYGTQHGHTNVCHHHRDTLLRRRCELGHVRARACCSVHEGTADHWHHKTAYLFTRCYPVFHEDSKRLPCLRCWVERAFPEILRTFRGNR